jgi:hypothetical protein
MASKGAPVATVPRLLIHLTQYEYLKESSKELKELKVKNKKLNEEVEDLKNKLNDLNLESKRKKTSETKEATKDKTSDSQLEIANGLSGNGQFEEELYDENLPRKSPIFEPLVLDENPDFLPGPSGTEAETERKGEKEKESLSGAGSSIKVWSKNKSRYLKLREKLLELGTIDESGVFNIHGENFKLKDLIAFTFGETTKVPDNIKEWLQYLVVHGLDDYITNPSACDFFEWYFIKNVGK